MSKAPELQGEVTAPWRGMGRLDRTQRRQRSLDAQVAAQPDIGVAGATQGGVIGTPGADSLQRGPLARVIVEAPIMVGGVPGADTWLTMMDSLHESVAKALLE